ncbi:MAG: hypothetical protein A3H70_01370 [Candidatus Komeilibacteria bacterium RIFCSPLOWO2_02_FULL_48_11]|uniref:Uncharacterized protein n=1 Tax=Candidatus Komeilibacteria bacterium RIFCSPLOWO2_02_FULL_48_11 TaxID=1798553 RepID=A0A1G2BRC6_9BACT|nr:MAG: hypothetical protein A3H70_01370 [Candidatus Komeilibacteria bacterium RIFCSPLOWO2_02_FULL_48_11]
MVDDKMVTHFVCKGGCGGVSPDADLCQAPTCSKFNAPFDPCGCTDGLHGAPPKTEEPEEAAL